MDLVFLFKKFSFTFSSLWLSSLAEQIYFLTFLYEICASFLSLNNQSNKVTSRVEIHFGFQEDVAN